MRTVKRILSSFIGITLLALGGCVAQPEPQPAPKPVNVPPPPRPKAQPQARIPENVPVVKVALLLPLSGEGQQLGAEMLDAATLALYDVYIGLPADQVKARVVLIPKDTGTSPTLAAQVAGQAVKQGAKLIIGPLYSQSVSAVAPIAQARNISVIALSNNRSVAGRGVFVYGFLPEDQVDRITTYALSQNISSFAGLAPNDAYGLAISDALKRSVIGKGGELSAVEQYAKTPGNMQAAAIRMSQHYTAKPFKALFVAENGEQASILQKALQGSGMQRSNYKLLGTGLWDEDGIERMPELQGGWFASASPDAYTSFQRRFVAAYGYKPKRLSSLTYDAVALAAQAALLTGGVNMSPQVFMRSEGFQGPANGAYRIGNDGITRRALAVMEITPSGFKVVDPAPKTLGN